MGRVEVDALLVGGAAWGHRFPVPHRRPVIRLGMGPQCPERDHTGRRQFPGGCPGRDLRQKWGPWKSAGTWKLLTITGIRI